MAQHDDIQLVGLFGWLLQPKPSLATASSDGGAANAVVGPGHGGDGGDGGTPGGSGGAGGDGKTTDGAVGNDG